MKDLPNTQPLFPEVGVIALVPDTWGGPWQPRHQVLTRLAHYFHIAWVNPPFGWRRLWFEKSEPHINLSQTPPSHFSIYPQELWLPKLYRFPRVNKWMLHQRLKGVIKKLQQKGCQKIILYLWRPKFADALDVSPFDLRCYHIDDEYAFSEYEQAMNPLEVRVLNEVDVAFIHSRGLMEKKSSFARKVVHIPNGVNYQAYVTQQDEPLDISTIPHPRIGYIGWLKPQLDLELLGVLATRHADWSFVLIGPAKQTEGMKNWIRQISTIQNVYVLGERPVDLLPAYTQALNVCLMNYKVNDYTNCIYPLKLHEYLAAGKPVVSTAIQSVVPFGSTVRLVKSVEEWSVAISESLGPSSNTLEAIQARQSIAKNYDWNALVLSVAHTMCEGLGPSYLEQLQMYEQVATFPSYQETPGKFRERFSFAIK